MSQTIDEKHNVTACYTVDSIEYCFYVEESVLSWNEAREFCARMNSTLPVITNENVDHVFQQFVANDYYNFLQNKFVWLDVHANSIQETDPWQWIDGQPSGLFIVRL